MKKIFVLLVCSSFFAFAQSEFSHPSIQKEPFFPDEVKQQQKWISELDDCVQSPTDFQASSEINPIQYFEASLKKSENTFIEQHVSSRTKKQKTKKTH